LQILEGIREAKLGKLQHGLLPYSQVKATLSALKARIADWHPDLTLVYDDPLFLYSQDRVRLASSAFGAVIQIPLELVRRDDNALDLYDILTIPVPLSGEEDDALASMISPLPPYMAISTKYYTTLDTHLYGSCHQVKGLHLLVCPFVIPLMGLDVESCVQNLWNDVDKASIFANCPFVFNNINQWGPRALNLENEILLYGIPQPQLRWCAQAQTPSKTQISTYSKIHKKLMCNCNIMSEEVYLKGYICESQSSFNYTLGTMIEDVVNPLTAAFMEDLSQHVQELQRPTMDEAWDSSKIYDALKRAVSPVLNSSDSFQGDNSLSYINLKEAFSEMLQSDTAERAAQSPVTGQLDQWFSLKLWTLAMTLVLSMVGTLGCMLAVYAPCRNGRTASIISAGLLGQAKPTFAWGGKVCRQHSTDLLWQALGTFAIARISPDCG